MTEQEKEIFEDLLGILDKIASFKENGKDVIPDGVILHVSYAMEHITRNFGVTDEAVKEMEPGYFWKKDN